MIIKELDLFEFDAFVKNHPLKSYHQTTNYALLMAENGYEYEFIGYVDYNNNIKAAALILYKKIGWKSYYGYSPKGFLIDYFDSNLLKYFTIDIKKYYEKKNFVFIKINPEIAIGEIKKIAKDKYDCIYNNNTKIINYLENNGYKQLKEINPFECLIPKYNGVINLENFELAKTQKNVRNKIRKCYKKGLVLEKASYDKINILYNFIRSKKSNRDAKYYKDYFNIFNKDDLIDLFLVRIDYEKYLLNVQKEYNEYTKINSQLNELIKNNPSPSNLNKKMESDKVLNNIKNAIIEATNGVRTQDINKYIAGALVIKYGNRIFFVISGFDKNYSAFNANYFLHYEILNYYKDQFKFADLNGLSGNFSKNNPYYGLNKFKLSFNPRVYEFIGEFDLIINEKKYNKLLNSNKLKKEFKKD